MSEDVDKIEYGKIVEIVSNTKANSTVLRPFYWMMIILVGLLGICLYYKESASWLLPVIIALLVIVVAGFMIAYFKCLNRNPDDLRSESYNISKLEIENNNSQNKFVEP